MSVYPSEKIICIYYDIWNTNLALTLTPGCWVLGVLAAGSAGCTGTAVRVCMVCVERYTVHTCT